MQHIVSVYIHFMNLRFYLWNACLLCF